MKLYLVYLGGKHKEDLILEDHRVFLVVAQNIEQAKEEAKARWNVDGVHVDGIKQITEVDKYQIILKKTV